MARSYKWLILAVLAFTITSSCYSQAQGQVISIPFGFNSATIQAQYLPLLDSLAQKLAQNPNYHIRMFGFTDTVGTEDYNDKLSARRINAVYDYLNTQTHLDKTKIYTSSNGEFEEKYDLHFQAAHVQQRYVDMQILFYKPQ